MKIKTLILPTLIIASITLSAPFARAKEINCTTKKLKFSADYLPNTPVEGAAVVWGSNATFGRHVISPPYSSDFLSRARDSKEKHLQVFAYLEGPCGNTGGNDDGETARCRSLHRDYNRQFAPNTPDTDLARWKPFTLGQMKESGKYGIDFCEIDNLNNNVTIPIVPLMKEIKRLYDNGSIYCKVVLKNLEEDDLDRIKDQVAPNPSDADFIAPFHIFEAESTKGKSALDRAMKRLKGEGAVTIFSLDTFHYGSSFTNDSFVSCEKFQK